MASNLPPRGVQLTCFTLLLAGQASLVVLMAVILFKPPYTGRKIPLFNFLFFQLLVAIADSLLFFTGTFMEENPPSSVCTILAVLRQGLEPAYLTALTFFSLECLLRLKARVQWRSKPSATDLLPVLGMHLSWIQVISWAAALTANSVGGKVSFLRDTQTYYCHPASDAIDHVRTIEFVALTIILILIQVWSLYFLVRHWRTLREVTGIASLHDICEWNIETLFRTAILSWIQIINLIILTGRSGNLRQVSNIYIALSPLTTAMVLGSEYDIWHGPSLALINILLHFGQRNSGESPLPFAMSPRRRTLSPRRGRVKSLSIIVPTCSNFCVQMDSQPPPPCDPPPDYAFHPIANRIDLDGHRSCPTPYDIANGRLYPGHVNEPQTLPGTGTGYTIVPSCSQSSSLDQPTAALSHHPTCTCPENRSRSNTEPAHGTFRDRQLSRKGSHLSRRRSKTHGSGNRHLRPPPSSYRGPTTSYGASWL